jgi:hypothetical protein
MGWEGAMKRKKTGSVHRDGSSRDAALFSEMKRDSAGTRNRPGPPRRTGKSAAVGNDLSGTMLRSPIFCKSIIGDLEGGIY